MKARVTAMRVLGKPRQHLQGFLLRHGRIYSGKKGWTLLTVAGSPQCASIIPRAKSFCRTTSTSSPTLKREQKV